MQYVGPLVALITSLLGAFFNEKGERQKLSWFSGTLLVLTLVSAGVTLYTIYKNAQETKEKAVELAREKKNSDSLRGLLMASAFAEKDAETKGIIIIDIGGEISAEEDAAEPESSLDVAPVSHAELFPLTGTDVTSSQLQFRIEDTVDYDYTFEIDRQADRGKITARYYEFEEKLCTLSRQGADQAFSPEGESCTNNDGYTYNAWVDYVPNHAVIIDLPPREKFWKIFSRLEQQQRFGSDGVGTIRFQFANSNAAEVALPTIRNIGISIKFFQAVPKSVGGASAQVAASGEADAVQADAGDDQSVGTAQSLSTGEMDEPAQEEPENEEDVECYTSLIVSFGSNTQRNGAEVTVEFGDISNYEFNFCEIVRI